MNDTIAYQGPQAAFGMPASARLRVSPPRSVPMPQEHSVAGVLGGLGIAGHVSDLGFVTVDAATKDAFWGTAAWSPPS